MKLFEKYKKDQELDPLELEKASEELIQAGLDHQKKEDWAQKLAQEHGFERPGPPTKTFRLLPLLFKVAAVITLIIGAYLIIPTSNTEDALQARLQLALQEEALAHSQVRKGESDEEAKQKAFINAYTDEDYQTAVQLGTELLQNPTNDRIENTFYLALSHFYLQDFEVASQLLTPLAQDIQTGGRFEQETKWFLSIAYLKIGQDNLARPLLEELKENQGWKSEAARQFLDLPSK